MKKLYKRFKQKLKERSASPAESTRLLSNLRQPQKERGADPLRRAADGLNSVVSDIRRSRKTEPRDLERSNGTEKCFKASMDAQHYQEACLLICALEDKVEAGGDTEFLGNVSRKMWEAVSAALTDDPNQIQSRSQFLKWTKKNQIGPNPDWGRQQWSKELEELYEGHINGQVPKLTQRTVDKPGLQDHLMKVKCKISELDGRAEHLPADLTSVYRKCLHVYLLNEVTSIAERKLGYHERVFLYQWTIREHRRLYNLQQGAEDFDPILFEQWFSDNGNRIVSSGQEAIRGALKEILQREILWNSAPRGGSHHCFSDIQSEMRDICGAVHGISDTLESRLTSALWAELLRFLSSYLNFLTSKMDKSDGMVSGNGLLMGVRTVRNSYVLRETLQNLREEPLDCDIEELLHQCESKGTEVVLRVLSPSLKKAFKWYFRKNIPEYEKILEEYRSILDSQAMKDKKMFNTLMEHRITALFIKSSFKHCCEPFQTNRAQSVVQASRKLLEFFSNLVQSDQYAPYTSLLHIATAPLKDSDEKQLGINPLKLMVEMLMTEGHQPLQITITAFQNEHPDLRGEHLLAILDIKGGLRGREKQDILYCLKDQNIFPLENRLKFFEDVDLKCQRLKYFLCLPCLYCC